MKVCPECQAVFNGRKWNGSFPLNGTDSTKFEHTLCTGCKRVRDKIAIGTVYLDGEAIASHSGEILRMIRREEEIERTHNHCSRILGIRHKGQRMTIQTANSLLAIHIARQLRKTFKGRLEIFKDSPGHRPRNKQSEGTVAVKWIQSP
jgi:hypothetical protein